MSATQPIGHTTTAPAPGHRTALVVGHDRCPAARAALRAAAVLARQLSAELHVVHSITLEDYGIDPDTEEFEAARDRNLAAERDEITELLDGSDLAWTYREQYGDPARALVDLADEVDAAYLVVGATRRGAMRHLLGGESVVKNLVAHQHRPVLVVPEPRESHPR